MSRHTDIADAVVAALNGHGFSQPFVAARKYRPLFKREQLANLTVSVVPSTYASEPANRAQTRSQYGVDVAVQKAVNPEINGECDLLLDLVHEIKTFFAMKRLDGLQAAAWQKVEFPGGADAGFAPEHLDQFRVFTGVVRLTWQVIE